MFSLLHTPPPSRIHRLDRCTVCGRWDANPAAHVGCAAVMALPLHRAYVWRVPVRYEPHGHSRRLAITLDCGHVVVRFASENYGVRPRRVRCRRCAIEVAA